MPLFVLVVQRSGEVEVAQHVGGGRTRLRVVPVRLDVPDQPLQQREAAPHPLVAGFEHLERLLEADRRRVEAGQRACRHPHCPTSPQAVQNSQPSLWITVALPHSRQTCPASTRPRSALSPDGSSTPMSRSG